MSRRALNEKDKIGLLAKALSRSYDYIDVEPPPPIELLATAKNMYNDSLKYLMIPDKYLEDFLNFSIGNKKSTSKPLHPADLSQGWEKYRNEIQRINVKSDEEIHNEKQQRKNEDIRGMQVINRKFYYDFQHRLKREINSLINIGFTKKIVSNNGTVTYKRTGQKLEWSLKNVPGILDPSIKICECGDIYLPMFYYDDKKTGKTLCVFCLADLTEIDLWIKNKKKVIEGNPL